jgi:flagellar basal body-associated protein FliL
MERFELTILAQGPQSIWVALVVVAVLCATAIGITYFICSKYSPPHQKER